jgi:hypothetical protein
MVLLMDFLGPFYFWMHSYSIRWIFGSSGSPSAVEGGLRGDIYDAVRLSTSSAVTKAMSPSVYFTALETKHNALSRNHFWSVLSGHRRQHADLLQHLRLIDFMGCTISTNSLSEPSKSTSRC